MRRFLLLFSAFSFVFLLNSCKTFQPEGIEKAPEFSEVKNLYFSSKETDYIYKGQIEIYGNNISGLLIIKKISDDAHRVVMTTDFGNKLLDFEISEETFKVNYITPDMDRETVKRFLEKDFRMLVREDYTVQTQLLNSTSDIYKSVSGKDAFYLYFDRNSKLLTKIIHTENNKEKINFSFDSKTAIFADAIELLHRDIKLKISLNAIKD